jgi:putative ABC transport system permease protein
MKAFLNLSFKSLWHRRETVVLSIFSLMLSVFLLLSVERLRQAAENGFTQTLSQTDLIVGARTGPMNLVLSTVFNRGTFANNISESTYQYWKKSPAVEWTIPLVLGDGHRGYRVVGTDISFYRHYRYQGESKLELSAGQWFEREDQVVIGSEVAKNLQYQMDQEVILDHGVTRELGLLHHDENPLRVSGILAPTGTIIDQSLFVNQEALEHMHHQGETPVTGVIRHKSEAADESPQAGEPHHKREHAHEGGIKNAGEHHEGGELTAFFVRLKNRVDVLRIQREINNDRQEPLSAVIPSVVVHELWETVGTVERALRILSLCILVVSLLSMLSILMATLNERRREMSILRALGASPRKLAGLLVIESSLITLSALLGGLLLQSAVSVLLGSWLRNKFGLFLGTYWMNFNEFLSLGLILLVGTIVGLIPAWRVYRSTLKDGLIVR